MADVPSSLSIQGRLTNDAGDPPSAGLRVFTFRIFDAANDGTEVWPGGAGEAQLIYTDAAGMWSAQVGDSIPLPPSVFLDSSRWLQITVNDGVNLETLTRLKLNTTPYTFRSASSQQASNADSLGGLPPSAYAPTVHSHVVTSAEIVDGTILFKDVAQNDADSGQVIKWDGASWTAADDNLVGGGSGSGWADDGNVVRLDHAGDSVGIGTATPAARLDVVGDVIIRGKAAVGPGNDNSGLHAFVAGENDTASGDHAVVSGGYGNVAAGRYATVSGGAANRAAGRSVVGGGVYNTADDGAGGFDAATVAGGMENAAINLSAFAGGGYADTASGGYAVVSGGAHNKASGDYSVVNGGIANKASTSASVVGGGSMNVACGAYSTVVGGIEDTASGHGATVAGGQQNRASMPYSFAAGYRAKADHVGTFVWADSTDADFASTGAKQFLIRAGGGVGIGTDSPAAALHVRGAIRSDSGGLIFPDGTSQATAASSVWILTDSVLYSSGYFGIARGGAGNTLDGDSVHTLTNLGVGSRTYGSYATVAGGYGNSASFTGSFVGGGTDNEAMDWDVVTGGTGNLARGGCSVIGGGQSNLAMSAWGVIGGGRGNFINYAYCTVGGGMENTALALHDEWSQAAASAASLQGPTTIAGGMHNIAWHGSFIGGGEGNRCDARYGVIAGGYHNLVGSEPSQPPMPTGAAIGGGAENNATGDYATIPGGQNNSAAGLFSLAAGHRAKADSAGSFVWADSKDFDFRSDTVNEFAARATGGVRFVSAIDGSGNPTSGVQLAAGAGAWATLSDSTLKENIQAVDGAEILERVAALPVAQWNYESQPQTVRHIGPMAQDFYRLFGVGEDDKTISTIDPAGIALAAIQELYRQNQELSVQNEELLRRLEALERRVSGVD